MKITQSQINEIHYQLRDINWSKDLSLDQKREFRKLREDLIVTDSLKNCLVELGVNLKGVFSKNEN